MRYTGPKARRVRRQGMNLFGSDKYDRILQKKPHGPGKAAKAKQGGRGPKVSEYGRQLMEKQKVCDMYGLNDRQLTRVYAEASRKVGQTDLLIKSALERRLDNALYRAGFANTRFQARQFVSHGLFMLNGKRVNIASMQVNAGDKIEVRSQSKASVVFGPILEGHGRYTPPEWLKVDTQKLAFDVVSIPMDEKHFEQAVDMRKVIGFYSR